MRTLGISVTLTAAIWLAGPGNAWGNDWATASPLPPHRLDGWLGITTRAAPPSPVPAAGIQWSIDRSDSGHAAWYGESMGVPTFNWGYFGVKSRVYSVRHGAYYDDYQEWGTRRGY
jgi:hypothetical protein